MTEMFKIRSRVAAAPAIPTHAAKVGKAKAVLGLLAALSAAPVVRMRPLASWVVLGGAAALLPVAQVQAAQPVQAQASGQVVRVNLDQGKIAIKHGAIGKLDLPAMTLVYHVDPALLRGIAVGDAVSFTAERANGQYRLVELEKK